MEAKMNFWVVVLAGLGVAAGLAFLLIPRGTRAGGLNRGEYLKKLEQLGEKYQKNPNDQKLTLEYAKELFALGEFSKSQEILKPLLGGADSPGEAAYLSAYVEYLNGNYARAEELGQPIIDGTAPDEIKMKAQLGLVFVYYQTNQYHKARNLFKGLDGQIEFALWEMMKAFGNEKPYTIDWGGANRSVVPFVVTDPLPVVSVKINGKQINVIIDTGGEIFYLDDAVASSLGIKSVARQAEAYAGGKKIEVGYGRADSLTIGDATLRSVPVKLGPIQRISSIFGGKLEISGILTTGILQQFLPTMDYPGHRLILRPRNELGRNDLKTELARNKETTVSPFVLALTHLMICKGSINGKDNLNLFIDSGLADSEAALCLPKETLEYVGNPIPPTEKLPEHLGGLAGGDFPVGRFTVDSFSLGSLSQNGVNGLYGVFPPELYHDSEFIIDGLVSHQFLKKYKWTIDFDSMRMIFSRP